MAISRIVKSVTKETCRKTEKCCLNDCCVFDRVSFSFFPAVGFPLYTLFARYFLSLGVLGSLSPLFLSSPFLCLWSATSNYLCKLFRTLFKFFASGTIPRDRRIKERKELKANSSCIKKTEENYKIEGEISSGEIVEF